MTIVDRIREQLSRGDGVAAEALEPLASAYALEVAQVNARLASCAALLRKGLRSEAIQQANVRPNLFDWAAALDFPEVDDWFEILQFYAITAPRRLNREAVQQLQEAMVEEQPLEELLRQHRRLAIGKAPLAWRLRVLRAIAARDTNNIMWIEDLETWEKARLRELPVELAQAINSEDLEACTKLATEVSLATWQIAPPAELIKEAKGASSKLEFMAQSRQLDAIGKSLYDSFCQQSESDCRRLRSEWDALVAQLKFPVPLETHEAVEPALLWLSELDQLADEEALHNQRVAQLASTLDHAKSTLDVQQAYQGALIGGREIPPELRSRYTAVLGELTLSAKRRSILKLSGIVAAALLAAMAFAIWQWQNMAREELAAAVKSLSTLLADRKLNEAKQYVDGLSTQKPHLLAATQMTALVSDMNGQLQAEEERVATFTKYIDQLESTSDGQLDMAVLLQAEAIAQSDGEKEKVFRLRRRQEALDRAERDRQFTQLNEELNAITAGIEALEKRGKENLTEADFNALVNRLGDAERKFLRAGPDGEALLRTVKTRVASTRDAYINAMLSAKRESRSMETIRSARTLLNLRQSLEEYASVNPKSPLAREFSEAAAEHELWTVTEDWNRFAQLLGAFVKEPTPENASQVVAERTKLNARLERFSGWELYPELDQHLTAVGRRREVLANLKTKLDRDVFSAFVTLRGATLDTPGGGARLFAYFNQIEPIRKAITRATPTASIGIEAINAADGTVAKYSFRGAVEVVDQPKQIYEQTIRELSLNEKLYLQDWVGSLLLLINKVMKEDSVDAVAKEILITQLLDAMVQGSVFAEKQLSETLIRLQQRDARSTKWFEERKLEVAIDPAIESDLRKSFGRAYNGNTANEALLGRLASALVTWVGVILRDGNGKVIPWTTLPMTGSGKLLIVERSPTKTDQVRLVDVGSVKDGKASIGLLASGLTAGRPIFFMKTD